MRLLGDVQCSTGNYKAMNLTNFCHTLNLVSFLWRVVLHLDLKRQRKKYLKHGCMSVEENELSEWSRHCKLTSWIQWTLDVDFHRSRNHHSPFCLCRSLLLDPHWIMMMYLSWTLRIRFISSMVLIPISRKGPRPWK